jgi:hypothetical protein
MKLWPSLLSLLLLPGIQGCAPMMYPLARAFGSPAESELKKCRVAFERLKAERATARILAYQALEPVGARVGGFPGTAEQTTERLRAHGFSAVRAVADPPRIKPTPLGANQLRYVWTRAHAYGAWVQSVRPEGDYHLFLEILAPPSGGILGAHCYILDGMGQVAYRRLMNSHHFGNHPPQDPEAACGLILQILLQDLERPADSIFPPYGVG